MCLSLFAALLQFGFSPQVVPVQLPFVSLATGNHDVECEQKHVELLDLLPEFKI